MLAVGVFAVPAGCYLAGRTGIALAFILEMSVFMPLFRVPAETDPAGDASGCQGRWSGRSGRMSM